MVLPALNLHVLDVCVTSKIDDVLLEHGGLPDVLAFAVQLNFSFGGQVEGTILRRSYSLSLFVGGSGGWPTAF